MEKNEKKIEDYLPFYIGCEVMMLSAPDSPEPNIKRFTGVNTDNTNTTWYHLIDEEYTQEVECENFKPILRQLSDISDEEKKEVYKLIFKRAFSATGQIFFREDKSSQADPRWMLCTGVDRVAIEMNGTVWADCDLQHYKYNQHEITRYLLKQGFDLFGLIDAKLAIDKTTLK